ncbi:MAG: anti-sigma factor antagonist [Desulfuromonas thiophila]|nr:anti-sigma factor antagonist [Desulfuromonas thiophila]
MEIQESRHDGQLVVHVRGRLDASWAEFFQEQLLGRIRGGEHRLLLDGAGLEFLSSMGIRALMRIYKELQGVGGSFAMLGCQGMVQTTLQQSGLGQWLSSVQLPTTVLATAAATASPRLEHFELDAAARLQLRQVSAWQPWQPVEDNACVELELGPDSFGLGIGAAGETLAAVRDLCGEFVAVGGAVALQPPDERGRPDCLLAQQAYVPRLHCLQALICQGQPGHLLRFRADAEQPCFGLSQLLNELFRLTPARRVGLVLIGEIEGLVGAQLIRSPGRLQARQLPDYPAIKDWLSFTGERVFAHDQAIISGLAHQPQSDGPIEAHLHAAVFPYQLLPNGRVELVPLAQRLFGGAPPRAVLHLVNDDRPATGLGESALYNGACWWSPLAEEEDKA